MASDENCKVLGFDWKNWKIFPNFLVEIELLMSLETKIDETRKQGINLDNLGPKQMEAKLEGSMLRNVQFFNSPVLGRKCDFSAWAPNQASIKVLGGENERRSKELLKWMLPKFRVRD